MAKVRKQHIKKLEPYLDGKPKPNGEWDLHCPLHEDDRRSASLNVNTGVWFCQACQIGGRISQLLAREDEWVEPPATVKRNKKGKSGQQEESITEAKIAGWMQALHADDERLGEFMETRGLSLDTVLDYEIGWDKTRNAYTIPVRGPQREIWNVRRYQLAHGDKGSKIWSVTGMGTPTLYPIHVFDTDPEYIIVCEGELDALATIQAGFPAVTRTGAAKVWHGHWNEHFVGVKVYVCHDMDVTGQDANRTVERALRRVADGVRVIKLPYEVVEKHGHDLTDYFKEFDASDFRKLIHDAQTVEGPQPIDADPEDASVLESFDSRKVGHPLRLTVTIKGKREPGFSIAKKAHLMCTRDAGDKCQFCPMNTAGGDDHLEIDSNDPVVLELMNAPKKQTHETLRKAYGAMPCNRLEIDIDEHQAVEQLYARPSVEHVNGSSADYKTIKLTSVGKHDTLPNNTVRVVGALQPDPRSQMNEFQVWDVAPLETTLDTFELDAKMELALKKFQPRSGQSPLKKLGEIAVDLANHVTFIYGRPEMHALMNLVWHSVLSFEFAGHIERKGWLDALVIGDTRTGKSEAAQALTSHFSSGEIITCESASFAGVVGGLQQFGAGKEWAVTWGVVPLNDRRLVVLDEVGGLEPEEIGQLSDVRSRGLAQLTKIQQERTLARTRLLWLGNPRNSRMSDYTYGVQAIRPLIGNSEDIARFDLAMSVKAGEVPTEEINREHTAGRQKYRSDPSSNLVRWVWSRSPDQILFRRGAVRAVYHHAQRIGSRYIEDPPLIQAANVRVKIARIAAALAGSVFSTKDGETLIVTEEHVQDSVAFLDRLYMMPSFGYFERSQELIQDRRKAVEQKRTIKVYLKNQRGLSKFLRGQGHFRRQDLEEILDVSREEANGIISTLYDSRMVRKDKGNVMIEPTLHELLREVK